MKLFGREIGVPVGGRVVPPEEMVCFGCGQDGNQVKKLIAGRPGQVFVCDRCVAEAESTLARRGKDSKAGLWLECTEGRRCSFCNKLVPMATAGKEVGICQACVKLCQDIIAEDRLFEAQPPPA